MDTDLSVRDIIFLRAVRDINANPGAYEHTEKGAVPANKTAITKATELGKKEVSYRLGGANTRGFEQGDEPLIIAHDPEIVEGANRFGPRSAELTEYGIDLLSRYEESGYLGGGDKENEPETIKQLRARLETLESSGGGGQDDSEELRGEIAELSARLDRIEASKWGGVDEQFHADLDKTVERLPIMFYVLSNILGVDVDRVVDEGPYDVDDEGLIEVREAIVETLGLDVPTSDSVDGSVSSSGVESDVSVESGDESESEGVVDGETEPASMADFSAAEMESDGGSEDDESVPPHLQNPLEDTE